MAGVAERQHGLFTHCQAVAAGCTPRAFQCRLESRRWLAVAEGVYRLAGAPVTWEQRLLALALSAGPGAAASHRSAAALLGIPGFGRTALEVSASRPRRNRDASIHSSRVLPVSHLIVVDGIPSTHAARTLFDLAAVLHPLRVERALDSCLGSGLVTLGAVSAVTAELGCRGRRGTATMRRLLDDRGAAYVPPASELERRFLEVLREAGLPEPKGQVDLGDEGSWVGRVDFVYQDQGVVIEVDGRAWHDAQVDLEADQRRDQRLAAAGWRVVRVRRSQLTERPSELVDVLRRLLKTAA